MKLVVQRVKKASVTVEKKVIAHISHGFLVLLGITGADTEIEANFLAEKLSKLRIMSDESVRLRQGFGGQGKMNLSIKDTGGEVLIISQFTLYGDTIGGNRPSFINAARPEIARPLYECFVKKVKSLGVTVQTGEFGADMHIDAILDGPVTILIEKEKS